MTKLLVCLSLWTFLPLALLAQDAAGQTGLKKIRGDGVELHYVEEGSGVPVVFIHGGLEDYRAWDEQVGAFSQRYRAIAYSRRYNFPNSGATFGNSYSAIVDAEDLAALIKNLDLAPVHLVGNSHGAYVALVLTARHPELVRSLVLSEPRLLRLLPGTKGGQHLFTEFMSKVWQPTTRGFLKSDEAGVMAAIEGFGELGYSGTDQKMTFATLPPEIRSALLENASEWKALTMSKDAFPPLPPNAIKHIKAPTLLLSGRKSLRLSNAIDAQLERLLPQGRRIILANATHEMWSEYPAECRNAAIAFFDKH